MPASRPRVSKYGTYYTKTYKAFRKEMAEALKSWSTDPLGGSLLVDITFHCKTPKKPTKLWPRGDIDNYVKGVFDAFNGIVWGDDDQVTAVRARKVYSDCPHIYVTISTGEDNE